MRELYYHLIAFLEELKKDQRRRMKIDTRIYFIMIVVFVGLFLTSLFAHGTNDTENIKLILLSVIFGIASGIFTIATILSFKELKKIN